MRRKIIGSDKYVYYTDGSIYHEWEETDEKKNTEAIVEKKNYSWLYRNIKHY